MSDRASISARFTELALRSEKIGPRDPDGYYVGRHDWGSWTTSALNLVTVSFGLNSVHYHRLNQAIQSNLSGLAWSDFVECNGIFLSAKEDFEKGFSGSFEKQIAGEIFGDLVVLAKTALVEGHKDVAAVLACAALEDTLKRFATMNGLDVSGKTMDTVISALKSKGLVQGVQKSLLDVMPRVRNCAMHADWAKITEPEVNSVIGFVESFLQTKF